MNKASVGDRILARLEGFAEALERGDDIKDTFTCRTVVLDLKPLPYTPEMVQKVRKLLGVSQAILGQLLGVSVRTIQAWEQGDNPPNDMACRWLDEIRRDPQYWLDRVKSAIVQKGPRKRRRGASQSEA
jgi:putative transcriptional regulator